MKIAFNENTGELLKPLTDYEIKKGHFEFKDKFFEVKNMYEAKNKIMYIACSNIIPKEVATKQQELKELERDEQRREFKKIFGMEVG